MQTDARAQFTRVDTVRCAYTPHHVCCTCPHRLWLLWEQQDSSSGYKHRHKVGGWVEHHLHWWCVDGGQRVHVNLGLMLIMLNAHLCCSLSYSHTQDTRWIWMHWSTCWPTLQLQQVLLVNMVNMHCVHCVVNAHCG